MRRLLMISLCLFSVMTVYGQQPKKTLYSYDENGNRVGREILFTRMDGNNPKHEWLPLAKDSFAEVEVSIYPNPAKDRVYVTMEGVRGGKTAKAILTTITGMVLEERTMSDFTESFDLSKTAPGVYLLELIMDDEKHIWKIIRK